MCGTNSMSAQMLKDNLKEGFCAESLMKPTLVVRRRILHYDTFYWSVRPKYLEETGHMFVYYNDIPIAVPVVDNFSNNKILTLHASFSSCTY